MTQLSRNATLGIGKESAPGTYATPTWAIPFTKAEFEDTFDPLRDESYRGNDTLLQGLYQGPGQATWDIDVLAYPDLAGMFLRGIIGPDTVTAGTSTTLAAAAAPGATSIQTAASIPANTVVKLDTGTNIEYVQTTAAPTGAGPYTSSITTVLGQSVGLALNHASGVAAVTPTKHAFNQSPTQTRPTYSLTVYDTSEYLEYLSAVVSDLQVTIDPKAICAINAKLTSFPGAPASTVTESYTQVAPMLGWSWQMTNAGASSTRGLTYTMTLKRATEAIHSSTGSQNPREVFAAVLESDAAFKAIYENQTDLNLFQNYVQQAATAQLQQPLVAGGASIALTMSKSGWTTAKRDLAQGYTQADYSLSGVYNSTDSGAVSAVLTNWVTTAY